MIRVEEVKSYKWVKLKENPPKNAVLYVLDPITKEVELFVTNKNGLPKPIKSYIDIKDYVKVGSNNAIIVDNNRLFVKKYNAGDEYIEIENSPTDYKIKLNVDKIELVENKQDSLSPDGTGTKYPTVDAVNEKVQELEDSIANAVGDKNFVYEQTTPSKIWEYEHGLGKKPSIQVTDSAGTVMMGQITVNDGTRVRIEFNIAFWGYATNN